MAELNMQSHARAGKGTCAPDKKIVNQGGYDANGSSRLFAYYIFYCFNYTEQTKNNEIYFACKWTRHKYFCECLAYDHTIEGRSDILLP